MRFLITALLALASNPITQAKDCILNTREDLPKEYQPLYLDESGTEPANIQKFSNYSAIKLRPEESLTLVCNGVDNYLLSGGKDISKAVCEKNGHFYIEDKSVTLKTITCKKPVKPTLEKLDVPCGQNAEQFEVGFKFDDKWLKVLRACYDQTYVTTRFVQHVVDPSVLNGSVQRNSRPSFKEGIESIFNGLSMATLYKKSVHEEMFERFLDTDHYLVDDADIYLAKGHLAADADFVFSNYQHATYFYINAAPQWQSINSGSWSVVERRVKQIAAKRGRSVSVTTGTHGILKLKDSSGSSRSIYLDMEGSRIPVPLYFWKAAIVDDEGIVFIASNNPFEGMPKKPLCRDICSLNGWKFNNRDVKSGKVICCSVSDAKKAIQHMPNLKASSILSWS